MVRNSIALLFSILLASRAAAEEPRSISEEELSALREKVRVACQLPPAEDARTYPWYFHYELGLELGERQDWEKAVDALSVAVDKRPTPTDHGRTYGMWFLQYRPYFNLGVAQYRLGRYECATNAFTLSAKLGELPASDPQSAARDEMLSRAKDQTVP